MVEKPKLKKKAESNQVTSTDRKKVDEPTHFSSDADRIPLLFQAQDSERGKIQYVEKGDNPKYQQWVNQWLEGCPPKPEIEDENIPKWQRRPIESKDVEPWDYQIRWRIITNGGQDESLIRPVIGAKGIPFFPGSSMKGAFRQACSEEQRLRYCGGEVVDRDGNKRTQPGILRFHGGYPVDMAWAEVDRLVDIAHGQQPYQVMRSTKGSGENANIQISLYRPKLRFGISCDEIPADSPEWKEIRQIWEAALSKGIGSRISAGYGHVEGIGAQSDRVLLSVNLHGQGVMSQLLLKNRDSNDGFPKTPEFRPNMMKAVLRGHTLRLLGGLTDEATTQLLAQKIWGGFSEEGINSKATVGLVGIDFSIEGKLNKGKHTYQNENNRLVNMPIYKLSDGKLSLIKVSKISSELEDFLTDLVKFSLLLGGYGKSWRRASHEVFFPGYFAKKDKPAIGCHWKLADSSRQFLVDPNQELAGITNFIDGLRNKAIAWIESEIDNYQAGYVQNWREAWHPNKVQVWGRIATKSAAIKWFHGEYQHQDTIYKSTLTGSMGKIGRIWHRMYPHEGQFIEFLTIFPDCKDETIKFLEFLSDRNLSDFQLLWGDPTKSFKDRISQSTD